MHRKSGISCLWLFAVIALAACGAERDPRVLVRGNGGDPGSLDPALAEDVHAFNILVDLYEGLLIANAHGALRPGVAAAWNISEDGRIYTFELRPDARWSNGDTVVAGDFVRAFRRVASPQTVSAYGFLLEPLANFSDVQAGRASPNDLGVLAADDRTLVITLEEPTGHFLSLLAMPVAFPMHSESSPPASFQQADRFVGNGPYVLASRQPDGPIELRKNPLYRDASSVSIESVRYLPIADARAELNMFRAGEIDITSTIPSGDIASLAEELPEQTRIAPSLALYYLAFDLSEPPLDDRQLRQALSMAIDRRQIARLTGRGEQPAFNIVPAGVANHVSAEYSWRDLPSDARIAKAQSLFAASRFGDSGTRTLKLTYDAGEDIHERIALAVSAMWRDVLEIDVELEKMEWNYFLDTRERRSDWQVMRFSWFGDYNDPMTFAEIFRTGHEQNLPYYSNADFDDALRRASAESDPESREILMTSAERLLIEDYPIAPLYFYVSKHLVGPNISGFADNALDRHPTRFLRFELPD